MAEPESVSMVDYVPMDAMAIDASARTAVSTISDAPSSMQLSSKDMSLFPFLDIMLKILPTVYIKGRNKCLCGLVIILCILALSSLPTYDIYIAINIHAEQSTEQKAGQSFVFFMYLFPFCTSIARLYFFAKYFDNNIWHYNPVPSPNNRISTISMDQNSDNLSYLLRQPSNIKSKIRKSFRIGFVLNLILYTSFFTAAVWVRLIFYGSISNDSEILNYKIGNILWCIIQFFFGALPDFGLICCARIYFTECYLHISNFTESINVITSFSSNTTSLLNDIITFNLIDKYLKIYSKISKICKQLSIFISLWILVMAFYYWFLITVCFFTDWQSDNISENKFIIPMRIELAIFGIQTFCAAMFMLFPAFQMTEMFEILYQRINTEIQILLKDKTHLHDEQCVDNLTKNHNYGNINSTDLHKQLMVIGQQKAVLEILSRLKSIMKERPCYYALFGLKLSKYSVRDFIVGILVAKVATYLWSGIDSYGE